MKLKFLWTFMLLTSGASYGAVQGPICQNSSQTCEIDFTEKNMKGELCLAHKMACGEVDDIINNLHLEQSGFALAPFQKYYLGSALYRKHLETRNKGDRCEYRRSAQLSLTRFLGDLQELFWVEGNFGSVDLRYIRHATKIVNDLKEDKGCLESSITEDQLLRETAHFGRGKIVDIFMDPYSHTTVGPIMTGVKNTLQGFISKASDVSNGIELRKVEVKIGENNMENVRKSYDEAFDDDENRSIDVPNFGEIDTFLNQSTIVESAFKKAVHDNQDNYQILKKEVAEKILGTSQRVTRLENISSAIFPKSETVGDGSTATDDEKSPLVRLQGHIDDGLKDKVKPHFDSLKAMFKKKFGVICEDQWYCED